MTREPARNADELADAEMRERLLSWIAFRAEKEPVVESIIAWHRDELSRAGGERADAVEEQRLTAQAEEFRKLAESYLHLINEVEGERDEARRQLAAIEAEREKAKHGHRGLVGELENTRRKLGRVESERDELRAKLGAIEAARAKAMPTNIDELLDTLERCGAMHGYEAHALRTVIVSQVGELAELRAACRIDGKPCKGHEGVVHGKEAEELRSAIEVLAAKSDTRTASALQVILDQVDARDSLAFLESTDVLAGDVEHLDRKRGERLATTSAKASTKSSTSSEPTGHLAQAESTSTANTS